MGKLRMLLAATLIVVTSSAVLADVKGMGRLNGKVIDEDGTALEGVSIRLRQGTDIIEGKTDEKGQWVLSGVARGSWMVTFEKDGFPNKSVKVVVEKELMRTDPIKITMKK